VSEELTLAAVRLAVAREYGFTSRTRLILEVRARRVGLADQVQAFVEASVRDGTSRAARMVAAAPRIAEYGGAAALVLGGTVDADAATWQRTTSSRASSGQLHFDSGTSLSAGSAHANAITSTRAASS
jgi:hypothetical protein